MCVCVWGGLPTSLTAQPAAHWLQAECAAHCLTCATQCEDLGVGLASLGVVALTDHLAAAGRRV